MHNATRPHLALEMSDCLQALVDFTSSDELSPEEVELRVSQYTECARGHWCPEAAFDPLAARLRTLSGLLARHPELRADWECRVTAAIVQSMIGRSRARVAPEALAQAA